MRDSLTFLARIVEALAWPSVALILLWPFKDRFKWENISRLFLKIGGFQVETEFDRETKEIAQAIHPDQSRNADSVEYKVPETDEYLEDFKRRLSYSTPEEVILKSWSTIDGLSRSAVDAQKGGVPNVWTEYDTARKAMQELLSMELLTPEDYYLFEYIEKWADKTRSEEAFEPSYYSLVRYIQLSSILVRRLWLLAFPRDKKG